MKGYTGQFHSPSMKQHQNEVTMASHFSSDTKHQHEVTMASHFSSDMKHQHEVTMARVSLSSGLFGSTLVRKLVVTQLFFFHGGRQRKESGEYSLLLKSSEHIQDAVGTASLSD